MKNSIIKTSLSLLVTLFAAVGLQAAAEKLDTTLVQGDVETVEDFGKTAGYCLPCSDPDPKSTNAIEL